MIKKIIFLFIIVTLFIYCNVSNLAAKKYSLYSVIKIKNKKTLKKFLKFIIKNKEKKNEYIF